MKIENVDKAVQLRDELEVVKTKLGYFEAVQASENRTVLITALPPKACRVDAFIDYPLLSDKGLHEIFKIIKHELAERRDAIEAEIEKL